MHLNLRDSRERSRERGKVLTLREELDTVRREVRDLDAQERMLSDKISQFDKTISASRDALDKIEASAKVLQQVLEKEEASFKAMP